MRRFEFVEGASNKFWEIEVKGHFVTIRFGKIGTEGQQQTKTLNSDAEANAQCQTLVAEKLRKGYVEVSPSSEADIEDDLDESLFWTLISDAKRGTEGDTDAQVENLIDRLRMLTDEELIKFADLVHHNVAQAYRSDVWAAAYLDNGGCDDDSFMDWRAGLVLAGKKIYESVLKNPDSLANFEVNFNEGFPSAPSEIWEERHSEQEMPSSHDSSKYPDIGELFPEDDNAWFCKNLPKLSAKHGLTPSSPGVSVGTKTTIITLTVKCDSLTHHRAIRLYELIRARMQCILAEDSETLVVVKIRSDNEGWAKVTLRDIVKDSHGFDSNITINSETQVRPQAIG